MTDELSEHEEVALALMNSVRQYHGLDPIKWDFPAISSWHRKNALRDAGAAIEAVRHRSSDRTDETETLRQRVQELEKLINTPHTHDWVWAVQLEAAHQIERWGVEQDAGKAPSDWFWLIGYLSGKALAAAITANVEKAKHHTISTGAALLNWHRHLTGESRLMRPGIAEPVAVSSTERAVPDRDS